MSSQREQTTDVGLLAALIGRVYPYRGKYVGKALGDRQNLGEGFKVDRNAQRVRNGVRPHRRDHAVKIGRELGEIDMAVRVYEQISFYINWMNRSFHLFSHIVWVGRLIFI